MRHGDIYAETLRLRIGSLVGEALTETCAVSGEEGEYLKRRITVKLWDLLSEPTTVRIVNRMAEKPGFQGVFGPSSDPGSIAGASTTSATEAENPVKS